MVIKDPPWRTRLASWWRDWKESTHYGATCFLTLGAPVIVGAGLGKLIEWGLRR